MSVSISAIGAAQPIFAQPGANPPYAPNADATQSVAATTAGGEAGAASVVYEPSQSDGGESYTYSGDGAARTMALTPKPANDTQAPAFAGDEAVVAATGGAVLPPPELPETPHAAEVKQLLTNVWAPVKPVAIDPAVANAAAMAPVQPGQAETSAQASYAAIADAQIAGAPIADIEKFA
jgi:hypothetical protein